MKLYDLTQSLGEGMSVPPDQPMPHFETIKRIGIDRSNHTMYTFRSHSGTHMDAPFHYYPSGKYLDEIPIERFTGKGYVIPMHKERLQPIHREDITAYTEKIAGLPFVLLSFGWARYYGTDEYINHPYIAEDAAQGLASLKIGCVCMDLLTPDIPFNLRQSGYKGPAHLALLGSDVLIIENVASLQALEGKYIQVYAFPAKILHSDGAPVRLVAAVEENEESCPGG